MAGASNIAQFLMWMTERAEDQGREVLEQEMVSAIHTGLGDPTGVQIYEGRPQSEYAKAIVRGVQKLLEDPQMVLAYVDDYGYSPLAIRTLLARHYTLLKTAPIGTDANCAYIDLNAAAKQASQQTQIVAAALAQGYGSQELGLALKTNGSRLISKAMRELSGILSGALYNKEV